MTTEQAAGQSSSTGTPEPTPQSQPAAELDELDDQAEIKTAGGDCCPDEETE